MPTIKAYCDKHGEYDAEVIMPNFMGLGRMESACPKCIAEYNAIEQAAKDAQVREREIQRFRSMNIPPMYDNATLESFDPYTPELKKALDETWKLVNGEYQSLVYTGPNGTGKTHLAIGALKKLGGVIYKMYGISCMIRATYVPGAKETELALLDRLATMPLLCIDEMGRSKGSDSELAWLSYVIDTSHSNGNKIILITNNHLSADCPRGGCPGCLENYLGDDVISRLCERGKVLKVNAKDYRRN